MIHENRLRSLVKEFSKRRILVVGDVGIDRYVTGNVERISPEAPVPIVFVTSEVHKLGLAANVADNIHALGGDSELVGLVGKDRYADEIRALLRKSKVSSRALIADPHRCTIVKERIVSDRQQLLRIDYETPAPIGKATETAILARVKASLRGRAAVDAVIVQDYAKGMLSKNLVRAIVKAARAARKPVLMDPNAKSSLDLYAGATFMTPSEAQHLPPEVSFRPLIGPAPESRLVIGWRQSPAPDAALAAFLSVAGDPHSPIRKNPRVHIPRRPAR